MTDNITLPREDIIRMAREAGFPDYAMGLASEDAWQKTELFAALVAEAEREACKKLAQEHAAEYRVGGRLYAPLGGNYALCAAVACDHIVHLIEERGSK
jgi:D-tyrosyl-tRNA(Tyr) deacylase